MLLRRVLQRRQPCGTDLLAVPPAAAALVERQAGVLSRAQLRALGFTPSQIRAAVAANRWQVFGRHVVVVSNAPLTPLQRGWVAVLLPGKPAALAGLSAATEGGLRGFEPDDVHIVVRHATHTAAPPWVRIHESRRFSASDINQAATPPRTRVARSVVDGATWSRFPRRACAILCAAVQQRLVTADQLVTELDIAGAIRHVRIMRDVLGDISGGGHTLAEIELGTLARRAGLPPPHRQSLRRELGGKVRYLDADFDLPDGKVLTVEVDGRGHMEVETWLADAERGNEILIAGQPVMRFPSLTIRLEPARVVNQLERMRLAHTP